MLCAGIAHWGNAWAMTLSSLIVQSNTPDHVRGRVLALDNVGWSAASALSNLLVAFVAVRFSPQVGILAATALTAAGYAVVAASDGEEALMKLRHDPVHFDAVLLDLTMPMLDGEDTLIALRMLAPHLPVVLTSGYSEQTVAQRFVGRGLADFLPKPYVSEELVASISAAVARVRE